MALHGQVADDRAGDDGDRSVTVTAEQQVDVVRNQGPGVDGCLGFHGQFGQAGEEVGPVRVVAKDPSPFDSARDDVVEDARCIKSRSTGHGGSPIAGDATSVKYLINLYGKSNHMKARMCTSRSYVPVFRVRVFAYPVDSTEYNSL